MKKIIILENNGGRLANQLWQYAVVYSFCLENNYCLENYCFFDYDEYFDISKPKNKIVRYLFFKKIFNNKTIKIRKLMYLLFSSFVKLINYKNVISSDSLVYLTRDYFNLKGDVAYLCGWNFRNPEGLIKYHSEIVNFFKPKDDLIFSVTKKIIKIKSKYSKVVGVHIRHGDYKNFSEGRYYFEFEEVRAILDKFLESQKNESVFFLLCSDDNVPNDVFAGLEYSVGFGDPIKDLFALSSCDMIISSESTFSQWAAYCGKIKNINFSRDEIDWPSIINDINYNSNPWLIKNL